MQSKATTVETTASSSDPEIEDIQRQVAKLKYLVNQNQPKMKKGNGDDSQKNNQKNATVLDPSVVANSPLAMLHGPFKEGQFPIQCYKCIGWDHSGKNCLNTLKLHAGGRECIRIRQKTPEPGPWTESIPSTKPREEVVQKARQAGNRDGGLYHNPDSLYRLLGEVNKSNVGS